MKALVIGRFQPVTLGHVAMLQETDSLQLEKILLGIGTNGDERTPTNPFSFDEVKQMWLPELKKLTTDVEIYRIPDINNPPLYAAHVEQITGCNEKDTVVVSDNDYTIDCFRNHGKNYQIHRQKQCIPFNGGYISATKVRQMLVQGAEWQTYVPESTRLIIERINGKRILREFGEQYAK